MSVPAATPQPALHSALRRLVARHPVASFLVMVFAVNCAVARSPLLTRVTSCHSDLLPMNRLATSSEWRCQPSSWRLL